MLNFTPFLSLYAKYRKNCLASLDPKVTQAKVLSNLINTAKNTKFGLDYDFRKISTVAEYQAAVPLRKYESFWNDYWQANYPILDNISWPGTVPYFALSSGTTSGTTKYIPVTSQMIKSNTKAGLDLLSFHLWNKPESKIFGGLNFMLGGSTILQEPSPNIFAGDLSGIAVKALPFWAQTRYFPPKELALLSDWEEKIDKLANSAISKDIRMIGGVPSWLSIFFNKVFEITNGKTIAQVFPNLEMLVHGGVNFSSYYDQFVELLKDTKAELREVYPASEGFIAIADRGYGEGLRLNIDNGIFYEFVPVEELDSKNPTRHWLANVVKDVNYAIVLTNVSGMWSYVLGDTIKFVDLNPARILITGRTSYSLSAFGEHLILDEVEKAINFASKQLAVRVFEYSVGAIYPSTSSELGGHQYFIELQSGELNEHDAQKFSVFIDEELSRLNEDYAAHRSGGYGLNPPQIKIVKSGSFASWMKSRGKLGGQNKVPRLISDPKLFAGLVEYMRDVP